MTAAVLPGKRVVVQKPFLPRTRLLGRCGRSFGQDGAIGAFAIKRPGLASRQVRHKRQLNGQRVVTQRRCRRSRRTHRVRAEPHRTVALRNVRRARTCASAPRDARRQTTSPAGAGRSPASAIQFSESGTYAFPPGTTNRASKAHPPPQRLMPSGANHRAAAPAPRLTSPARSTHVGPHVKYAGKQSIPRPAAQASRAPSIAIMVNLPSRHGRPQRRPSRRNVHPRRRPFQTPLRAPFPQAP